jgi:lipopolysaccharide/colanic/teichoic acid biosynthesis glycosyltransferase
MMSTPSVMGDQECSMYLESDHPPRRSQAMPRTAEAEMRSMSPIYPTLKRIFDFVAAVAIFICAIPVMIVMGLIVKLTSRGPVIYSQKRVGLHGRDFMIFKIRTMYQDAESRSGPQWATEHDPRITPIGRFLRKSHLDELPQLVNILRGEMSLVGPRPERPEFTCQLEKAIPHYRERLSVRPGVTGLAQIQLPPDVDLQSVRKKLSCDLFYVEHLTFWLDFRILLVTALGLVGIKYPLGCRLLRIPDQLRIESTCKVVRVLGGLKTFGFDSKIEPTPPAPAVHAGPVY